MVVSGPSLTRAPDKNKKNEIPSAQSRGIGVHAGPPLGSDNFKKI
jgi:hypothetical protein